MSSYGYGGRSLKGESSASNVPPSWRPLLELMPYLWPPGRPDLKWRVVVSMIFLVLTPVVTVATPVFLGRVVDRLQGRPEDIALFVPIAFIVSYGVAWIMSQAVAQVRDGIFARPCYHALRVMAVETFHHLHGLSLRFHLQRHTGGLSRIIDRGTKAVDRLLTLAIFNIFPTALQLVLICWYLWAQFSPLFTATTVIMIIAYAYFTFAITRRRIHTRRVMNDSDNEANSKAVDSLLNYETVKYFGAELHEEKRFDAAMAKYSDASIVTQISLSVLNTGQRVIAACGVVALMILAAVGVKSGTMRVGDLVMVNALLIQLFIPLNLLGTVYRDISQGLIDMETMFNLLRRPQEIMDKEGAQPLLISHGDITFNNVVFAYDPDRTILKGVSFRVPAGKTVAVVGPTGAGKSTISRILYRFYDIQSGSVTIDGQDIRDVTQASLRAAIGIVPQDTVLFNDTIRYNIGYGRIGASEAEILEAARLAQIDPIIRELPAGYQSMVGERGLKLSGGEKQRVAIARTLLKNPPILLLDEATSALDTHTEREIQSSLKLVSKNRTTLVIAHRLSTIIDADEILVLDRGQIVERGRHGELIARGGAYAAMWNRQKEAAEVRERLQAVEGDPEDLRGAATDPKRRVAAGGAVE
jgi:ABC-type transport system involved in Fe-S cluster assembly fused permease/ATPase subunit